MFIWSFAFFHRKSERNFGSAFCNFLALAFLFVSLTDERWFYLHGGQCKRNSIGLKTFLNGKISSSCVDRRSIFLFRTIVTFIFLTIFSSLFAFILDLIGSMRIVWKSIRRLAIFQIFSVFLSTCVLVLCFCLSEILYENQLEMRKKILVQYDIAYYLLVLANNFSLLSIIVTLIRRYPTENQFDEQNEHFISDAPPAYSE